MYKRVDKAAPFLRYPNSSDLQFVLYDLILINIYYLVLLNQKYVC